MLKNKKTVVTLVLLITFISLFFVISRIDKQANLPKFEDKLWDSAYRVFMNLPDSIKSLFMIFSGKRSFANLSNDYNVKFLPETQYIRIDFKKKKLESKKKKNRYTFYLENFNDKLLVITKDGDFYQSDLSDLIDEKKIDNKKIPTNKVYGGIRDTLIIDDTIFISKGSTYENCNNLEIYSAKIASKLNFEIFKKFEECTNTGIGAGRIQRYKHNNYDGIIISTLDGDNDVPGMKAQDDNSVFGKIVFIDFNTKKHEIISKGHRNTQGLFVKDDIILSSEHGPKGGDEINRIYFNKNYGWPIASYGEPYRNKNLKYFKSHSDNGFEEPIFVFLPSIGISELIILPNSFDPKWKNNVLVTSLNDRSIYRMQFQDESFKKILYSEKIYIGERIRDIKYIEKYKAIIIALERTGNIGVLKNTIN